jgi:ATP-dependent DNA helicase RecQ
VRDWIELLVSQGYLSKTGEYNILGLTPRGLALNRGEETPLLTDKRQDRERRAPQRRASTSKRSQEDLGPFDPSLFQVLRQVRRAIAAERGVAPFIVFGDRALRDMACCKPLDRAAFLQVRGVSDHKCDAFGSEFIAAITAYCEEAGRP